MCGGIAGMVEVGDGAGLVEVKDPREGTLHFVSLGWYGLGGKGCRGHTDSLGPVP